MASQQALRKVTTKPRIFIFSDISNEPDDAESLVRYLLYSNEFDTRGLVACTSTWLRRVTHPEDMEAIIRAYGEVVDNLNAHVHPTNPYQPAKFFLGLVKTGPPVYGLEALNDQVPLSGGSRALIKELDESEEPLWVLCWGGTNAVAQALQHVDRTRAAEEARRLRSKMRIYAISDQDDTGMYMRIKYPDLFYIASVHGWNHYGCAAWTGISGDKHYGFDKGGPDSTKITKEWIRANIQIGPLGSAYPDFMFIPEGDTPTFLYLIQNGLSSPENPSWGSWGGRYVPTDVSLSSSKHYSDAIDRVVGRDNVLHTSNHATIWRWRDAYQNDFAARMRWSLTPDITSANHAPVAIVNGSTGGPEHVYIEAEAGSEVVLDASASYDPDGHDLSFSWLHYKDVTATHSGVDHEVQTIEFIDYQKSSTNTSTPPPPGSIVRARMPPASKAAVDMFSGEPLPRGQVMHLILAVTDSGSPSLTTYKRVIVQITNPRLEGRRPKVDAIADVHRLEGV